MPEEDNESQAMRLARVSLIVASIALAVAILGLFLPIG